MFVYLQLQIEACQTGALLQYCYGGGKQGVGAGEQRGCGGWLCPETPRNHRSKGRYKEVGTSMGNGQLSDYMVTHGVCKGGGAHF